jgi:hypothetical protein
MSQTARRFRALAITLLAITATNFAISFAANLKSAMTAPIDAPRPKSAMTAPIDAPRPKSAMTAPIDAPRP